MDSAGCLLLCVSCHLRRMRIARTSIYDSFPYRRCLDLVKSRVFDVHTVFALRLRIGGKIPGEILPSFADV